jgi:hypothetical protein
MRLSSILSLVIALAVSTFAAGTNGIVGTPTVNDGNNRPSITGALTSVITVPQGDTLMFGAARDSVTAKSNSYRPWSTSLFNARVPATYEAVTSNKDSLVLCIVGYGDADTTAFSTILQARVAGSTSTTNVWVTIGSAATVSFFSATEVQTCVAFPHPRALDFRFRSIGSGSTDTSRVRRFMVYDK